MIDFNWDARDAQKLAEFLEDPTGQKLKFHFLGIAPTLGGNTFEEKALNAEAYSQWLKDKEFFKLKANVALFAQSKQSESPYLDDSPLNVK